MEKTIGKLEAFFKLETIKHLGQGKIFSVSFVKKNGKERTINGRFNVKKGVTGKGLRFYPLTKGLLSVYDIKKKGFRFINLKTVTGLKIDRVSYNVI